MAESLAVVVARIVPPAGYGADAIMAASEQAAQNVAQWRDEAERLPPMEQRKYYILRKAVAKRDEILRGAK